MWFCMCDPVFSRFSRTPICDRQTQTWTQGHSIYCASITSHSKNDISVSVNYVRPTSAIGHLYFVHWCIGETVSVGQQCILIDVCQLYCNEKKTSVYTGWAKKVGTQTHDDNSVKS